MIVDNCPRCFDPVRIPDHLAGGSKMRCPLCLAEYDLSEALDHLPPALEVVGAPQLEPVGAEALAGIASGGSSVLDESIAAEGSGVSFGFLDVGNDGPSHSEDKVDAPGAFVFDAAASSPIGGQGLSTSMARPQKRKSGGAMMIVKVFLGGAAGLAIAFFAILWIPFFPDNDPFGAAQHLPEWMVPAHVRGSSSNSGDAPTNNERETAENRTPTRGTHRGMVITPEDGVVTIPRPGTGGDNDHPFGLNVPSDNTDPIDRGNPDDSEDNSPFGVGNEIVDEPEFFGPSQLDPDPLDLGPEFLPEDDFIGIRNAPAYEPTELGQAYGAAIRAKQAWNDSDGVTRQERRILGTEFYEALCEMAEKVTFVDAGDSTIGSRRDAVMGLLYDIGESSTDYSLAGILGEHQLEATQRSTDGILIAGTVVGIEFEGELYNTRVELATRGEEKSVYSIMSRINPLEPPTPEGQDPEPAYQIGSRVLICGSIVEMPEIKLGGYNGDEVLVIWGGLPLEVDSP